MAEKKIVSAKDAKNKDYSKAKSKDTSNLRQEGRKKNTMKYRIPAFILWALAIVCEVVAVFFFNRNLITPHIWIALGLDAVFVIVGSRLWIKANHVSPCTSDSKFVCFLQNQLGMIMALLALLPFGIILLSSNKELKGKQKQILTIVTAVLVLGSVGASIDYRPATPESVQAAEEAAAASGDFDGTVYWTQYGKSYHLDPECPSLSRSTLLIEGTIEEAFEAKRFDPCDFCAGGDTVDGEDHIHNEAEVEDEAADMEDYDEIVPEDETAVEDEEESLDDAA